MSPTLILVTVASYIAALFIISYFASRRSDNASFFSGNRKSRWYLVAIAMIGASMSGVTYVSVPGMVATSGFGYLQMFLGFITGQLVIAYVLTPLFYKMKLTSIYQYLSDTLGASSYRTSAWFFFLSKMLGAAVRLFLVCATLQLLAFGPLGLPFGLNVVLSVGLVWLYTARGGVKSVIWTDVLKTLCLVVSVVLCIVFIARDLHLGFAPMLQAIGGSPYSRVFFFDDVNSREYFFKQFLAGAFTMIAMTGLDQDMMQRNLSCRNYHEAQKNMMVTIFSQFFVVLFFLMLGVLLYLYAAQKGITATGDKIFPVIATGGHLPLVVGVLFIIGFVSSAYNAAGSALTALTTSFTIDILGIKGRSESEVTRLRRWVHVGMAVVMGLTICLFDALNSTSVIDAVYILASYTYGPIMGMFAFAILVHRPVRDRLVPLAALLSPLLCLVLDRNSAQWFGGYHFSYELLIFNAFFTFAGMCCLIRRKQS